MVYELPIRTFLFYRNNNTIIKTNEAMGTFLFEISFDQYIGYRFSEQF